MPCKDTTSQVIVKLDGEERLADFYFSKLTCNKPIGGETGFREYCLGRPARELVSMEFAEALGVLAHGDDEEAQFLLYMEWDAMRSALEQYFGGGEPDGGRCQIDSLAYDEEGVEIRLVIHPLKEMPKIIPCSKRNASAG